MSTIDDLSASKIAIVGIVAAGPACPIDLLRQVRITDNLQIAIDLMELHKLGLVSYRLGDSYIRPTRAGIALHHSFRRSRPIHAKRSDS